jgi:hypothetical protein
MASRKRAHLVPALSDALGGAPVAWDPKGRRPREESVWPVRKLALELRDPGARFHLVVQDDAIVGERFHERLAQLLTDEMAYSLFWRPKNAKKYAAYNEAGKVGRSNGYFDHPSVVTGLAIVLPSSIVGDLIAACDEMTIRSDDLRMQNYLRSIGMQTRFVIPSLINHRTDVAGRNGPNRGRQARWFR